MSGAAAPEPQAPDPTASPAASSFQEDGHGHFIGEVSIGNEPRYAEALLTVDGEVRIYVGGSEEVSAMRSGLPPPDEQFHPQESMLFVGRVDNVERSSASGSGAVIGQICDSPSARFCDEPANANLSVASSLRESVKVLTGELTVSAGSSDVRWPFELESHSSYYTAGAHPLGEYDGRFQEFLAPFAQAEEMIVEIGPNDEVRFASEVSGCTGDGTVLPYLDGTYDVHDVHLEITGCAAPFDYLNSAFEGLATETQGGYWDYDLWLVVFLAAADGPPPRPALTMRAYLMGDSDGEGATEDDGEECTRCWDY